MDYGLLKKYTRHLKVLFIEDEPDFRGQMSELLLDVFPNVKVVENGELGLKEYTNYSDSKNSYYNLIITDIKMPCLNGVELVKSIYKINPNQVIIVISARSEFDYLLPLVNMRINLFLTKPVNYPNFLVEIKKISKYLYTEDISTDSNLIFITEKLIWNKKNKVLKSNNKNVLLTKKEILLISLLLSDINRTYTINEILMHLWNNEYNTYENLKNLKNIISRLRKKAPELHIINLYSVGYRIECQ